MTCSAVRSREPPDRAREETPNVVDSAGKPNPHTFPFESIVLNLKPPLGHPEGSLGVTSLTIDGSDLDSALQYGPTSGLPKFRALLEEFQSKIHNRPQDPSNWTVTTGGGSQDMMVKVSSHLKSPRYLPNLHSVDIHGSAEPRRPDSRRDARLRRSHSSIERSQSKDDRSAGALSDVIVQLIASRGFCGRIWTLCYPPRGAAVHLAS